MAAIRDLAAAAATLPEQQTLHARKPWTPQSEAVVAEDDSAPDGFDYLLEVDLARQVIEVWSRWRGGEVPTPHEAAVAVIYYATFDTYQPVEHEQ